MAHFTEAKEKFFYVWKIKNIRCSTQQTGQFIASPEFCVPHFKFTKWHLKLYPQNCITFMNDSMSCFLSRGDDNGPETLEVKFKISLNSKESIFFSEHAFKKNEQWGFCSFLSHKNKDYKVYEKCMVITLEMLHCELYSLSDRYNLENSQSLGLEKYYLKSSKHEELISTEDEKLKSVEDEKLNSVEEEELNSVEDELNNTEVELNSTEAELNSTEAEVNSTEVEINSTEVEMNCNEDELYSAEEEVEQMCIENKQTQSSLRNYFTLPIKCFVETEFLYERKSIQKYIDLLINGSKSTETLSLILPKKYPSLIVDLKEKEQDDDEIVDILLDPIVDIHIRLTGGKVKNSLLVFCKQNVEIKKNNEVKLLHSYEEKHTFTAENESWCLTKSLDKSDLKTQLNDFSWERINLILDFEISFGENFSKVSYIQCISVPRYFVPGDEYIVSNEMFRLYRENKLCDFTLKVGDEKFDVHKVVLCAASPVFNAMFTNKMTENKTNVMDILDFDKKTIEELIFFVYTGSIKKLEYEIARSLFIAGDKYQILSLVNMCRNVLISQICSQNIYEILSFANVYDDKKLETEAIKFIKLNEIKILSSVEWRNFEKENMNLAVKTLRKVCLLKQRNAPLSEKTLSFEQCLF